MSSAIVLAQAADPDLVRQTVRDVLSQADYAIEGGPSLLDRALSFVLEQLGRLLLRFDGDGGTGSLVAALALIAVVLALAVAAVVFVRRLRRAAPLETVVTGQLGRSPTSWADEAAAHERDGDLRQALRCRYREVVSRLATAQLIDEVPGRTTGEYLRDVRAAVPEAAAPFEAITRRFEDTWYGGRDVDGAMLADVIADRGRVLKAARLPDRSARTVTTAVGG